jgi:hypothetical protein
MPQDMNFASVQLCAATVLLLVMEACSFATRENATTLPFRLYGNGQITRAQMAWNGSGRGEIWFSARDGEEFAGEYTTISPEVYSQDLSVFITRVGRTPFVSTRQGFGYTTSNIQYGLASAAGDRGTTVVCKYIVSVGMWTFGFSATGACLDSKGKNYSVHASSDATESASLKAAETRAPLPGSDTPAAKSEPTDSPNQSEKFAAFLGSKTVKETPPPPPQEPAQPMVNPNVKFYGTLIIYAGRIVPLGGGSSGSIRAEFEEVSSGRGRVRITDAGNNLSEGTFTSKKTGESGSFQMITQKSIQQLGLSKPDGWGMLSATDVYGTLLECVYGTVAVSKRKAGLCEDTRGSKYRLFFD